MNVILGADHGGFKAKEELKSWLVKNGYRVVDVGASTILPEDDYSEYAKSAVKMIESKDDRVILFCRNGFGMVIAANRFVGVRCGLAFSEGAVAKGRIDDDINCLSIPADYFDGLSVIKMVEVFLSHEFAREDKYIRRVMKLDSLIQ